MAIIPRTFGLLVAVALGLPLALGACCSEDKPDENNANRKPVPETAAGLLPVDSPQQCWAYLVEALTPEFEPPVDKPEAGQVPPGRPVRVWTLLAHDVRDRLGSFDAFMKTWDACHKRLLTVFRASRTVTGDADPADGDNEAPPVGTIRTLTVAADGSQPAVELRFVYEFDKARFPGEAGARWRLKADGIDELIFGKKPTGGNGNGNTDQ